MSAVTELAEDVGVSLACRAFSLPRSTFYRWSKPAAGRRQPRPTPARALSRKERSRVYEVLCSERFVDASLAETAATLLDEGVYLCSAADLTEARTCCRSFFDWYNHRQSWTPHGPGTRSGSSLGLRRRRPCPRRSGSTLRPRSPSPTTKVTK